MSNDTAAEEGGGSDEPAGAGLLKQFHSAGRGFWRHVPEAEWNDWHWQLNHRVTLG